MKTLFMETTKINPVRTVVQIQSILGEHGASAILTQYEKGEVVAVSFQIRVNETSIPFILPCRWQTVHQFLCSKYKRPRQDLRPQAKRIAWRQILRWVEAQLALVDTNMVSMQEVFMPYIQGRSGKTLYEQLSGNNFALLESKTEDK